MINVLVAIRDRRWRDIVVNFFKIMSEKVAVIADNPNPGVFNHWFAVNFPHVVVVDYDEIGKKGVKGLRAFSEKLVILES